MQPMLCAGRKLDLTTPLIMGVINVTPDSFSDGGTLYQQSKPDLDLIMARARAMVEEGAAILDVGGESTRPGADRVSVEEEMNRVLPVIERISAELDVVISLDSSTPQVMTEAARLGAGLLNDVRALGREGALQAAAATGLPICLMHMQGDPDNMQANPCYSNVVNEVLEYLSQRVAACEKAGIERQRLMIDPGFGFGKTLEHNLQLLAGLEHFTRLGLPILVGLSRKSMIGKILGREVDERMPASVALALLAAERGANIIRSHDVAATRDALAMWVAVDGQLERQEEE
jgi:dihydropteroate synthase